MRFQGSWGKRVSTAAAAATLVFGVSSAAWSQAVRLVPSATRIAGVGTIDRGYNSDSGPAGSLDLNLPSAVAHDSAGNLLVADTGNNCVRRAPVGVGGAMETISGLVTSGADTCNASINQTPTASQGLLHPSGLAADSFGNVFVADTGHNCVRELPAGALGTAHLQTIAGTCGSSPRSSSTPSPYGLATDASGNLYIAIADTTDGVSQVLKHPAGSAAGAVCLAAGTPGSNGIALCAGGAAVALSAPMGVAVDGSGTLYIADTGNNCVRKLQGGQVSTVTGTCGSGSSALQGPASVAVSQSGFLYIAQPSTNQVLVYQPSTGTMQVAVGYANGAAGVYGGNQDGAPAPTVPLNAPVGLSEDGSNNIYIADTGNSIVRELSFGTAFPTTQVGQSTALQLINFQILAGGTFTTTVGQDYTLVAGADGCSGSQGAGHYCTIGVAFAPTFPGQRVSPLSLANSYGLTASVPLSGTGLGPQVLLYQGQPNTVAALGSPRSVRVDSKGNVYALTLGTPGPQIIEYPVAGGAPVTIVAAGAGIVSPVAIATDGAGNWFVADTQGGPQGGASIERFGADGSVNLGYVQGITNPVALQMDVYGNLYVAEGAPANDVLLVYAAGERVVLAGGGDATPAEGVDATAAQFQSVSALAVAPDGTLYVADMGTHQIYSTSPADTLHVIAGNGSATPVATNAALAQGFVNLSDLATDAAGDVFIVDSGSNRLSVLQPAAPSNGNLIPLFDAGGTAGYAGDGTRTSDQALLNQPVSVAVASNGTVYVADFGNNALRDITFPPPTLDFGARAQNSTAAQLKLLWNDGNQTLVLASLPHVTEPASDLNAFQYSQPGSSCGTAVPAGISCDLDFTFTPTASPGTVEQATVTISDDAPYSPQLLTLTGTSAVPAITSFTATDVTFTYGSGGTFTVTAGTNGAPAPTGTLTITAGGVQICSATVTLQPVGQCTVANTTLPAGTYTAQYTFTSSAVPTVTANANLVVVPYALTEAVNDQVKSYLIGPMPRLTGTPNGVLAGVGSEQFIVTYSSTVTASTPPGVYPGAITATITPAPGVNPNNYTITNTPGTFTIFKIDLDAESAPAETEIYGGAYTGTFNFATPNGGVTPTGFVRFTVNGRTLCTGNLGNGTATCTLPSGTGLQAGTYPLTASYYGDPSYYPRILKTTLTVSKAPLTVTVNNATAGYGAPPLITGTVSGLVNGDVLGQQVIVSYSDTAGTSANAATYAGALTASVTGSSAGSYDVTVQHGTLTLTSGSTTTTLSTSAANAVNNNPVTLTATVTSSLGVPFGNVDFTDNGKLVGEVVLDAHGIATLSTSSLAPGTHTIVATYAGNVDFTTSSAQLTERITLPIGYFQVVASPDTQVIRGPGKTVFQVAVVAHNGFSGPVSLSCSGLPSDATCTFSNPTVNVTSGPAATATVTIVTTNSDATAVARRVGGATVDGGLAGAISAAAALPMELGGIGMAAAGMKRRRKLGRAQFRVLLFLALGFGLMGLAGCGCPSTANHTYAITVTGTSVDGGPSPSSSVVYLTVGLPQ